MRSILSTRFLYFPRIRLSLPSYFAELRSFVPWARLWNSLDPRTDPSLGDRARPKFDVNGKDEDAKGGAVTSASDVIVIFIGVDVALPALRGIKGSTRGDSLRPAHLVGAGAEPTTGR